MCSPAIDPTDSVTVSSPFFPHSSRSFSPRRLLFSLPFSSLLFSLSLSLPLSLSPHPLSESRGNGACPTLSLSLSHSFPPFLPCPARAPASPTSPLLPYTSSSLMPFAPPHLLLLSFYLPLPLPSLTLSRLSSLPLSYSLSSLPPFPSSPSSLFLSLPTFLSLLPPPVLTDERTGIGRQ